MLQRVHELLDVVGFHERLADEEGVGAGGAHAGGVGGGLDAGFGDLDDAASEVSVMLKKRKYKVLAPEAGTGPQVYFLI